MPLLSASDLSELGRLKDLPEDAANRLIQSGASSVLDIGASALPGEVQAGIEFATNAKDALSNPASLVKSTVTIAMTTACSGFGVPAPVCGLLAGKLYDVISSLVSGLFGDAARARDEQIAALEEALRSAHAMIRVTQSALVAAHSLFSVAVPRLRQIHDSLGLPGPYDQREIVGILARQTFQVPGGVFHGLGSLYLPREPVPVYDPHRNAIRNLSLLDYSLRYKTASSITSWGLSPSGTGIDPGYASNGELVFLGGPFSWSDVALQIPHGFAPCADAPRRNCFSMWEYFRGRGPEPTGWTPLPIELLDLLTRTIRFWTEELWNAVNAEAVRLVQMATGWAVQQAALARVSQQSAALLALRQAADLRTLQWLALGQAVNLIRLTAYMAHPGLRVSNAFSRQYLLGNPDTRRTLDLLKARPGVRTPRGIATYRRSLS